MAEITPLPRQHKTGFSADPEVVKMLQDLLEMAKEGRVRALATAVVYHDDLVPDGETGSGWALTVGTRFALAYAIKGLETKYAHHCHINRDA